MAKCKVCGTQNDKDVLECVNCGWDLEKHILSSYGFAKKQRKLLNWGKDLLDEYRKVSDKFIITDSQCRHLISQKAEFEEEITKLREENNYLTQKITDLNNKIDSLKSNRHQSIEENLKSDFPQLKEFLINEEWEKADKETHHLMLEIYYNQSLGYIRKQDVRSVWEERKYLSKIDELWFEHSYGKFGFTIQSLIYNFVLEYNHFSFEEVENTKKYNEFVKDFECFLSRRRSHSYHRAESYESILRQVKVNDFAQNDTVIGKLPILRFGEIGGDRYSNTMNKFLQYIHDLSIIPEFRFESKNVDLKLIKHEVNNFLDKTI